MFPEAEQLLRCEGRHRIGRGEQPWVRIALILCVCGLLYGAVMGSFGARALQSLYSALKVPLLLLTSSVVCLPSFYVVNTILGLRDDFAVAFRGILAAQASVAICLASLAPVTVFSYVATNNYRLAILMNGFYFAIATLAGQITLSRHYEPLVQLNPRHRLGRRAWILLYIFVAIQLAWVLRPFVGAPDIPTQFFRTEAWSNAYVVVTNMIWELLAGS